MAAAEIAFLKAQNVQLERQLKLFRQLVLQHNGVLAEVHHALQSAENFTASLLAPSSGGDGPTRPSGAARGTASTHSGTGGTSTTEGASRLAAMVSSVRQRVAAVLDRQASVFRDPNAAPLSSAVEATSSCDDRMEGNNVTGSAARPGAAISRALLAEGAADAASRIREACLRLVGLWVGQVHDRVIHLLAEPTAAFNTFHEAPSEAALEKFLDAYTVARDSIVDVFDGSSASAPSKPFEGATTERVLDLFRDTIVDAVAARMGGDGGGDDHGRPPTHTAPSLRAADALRRGAAVDADSSVSSSAAEPPPPQGPSSRPGQSSRTADPPRAATTMGVPPPSSAGAETVLSPPRVLVRPSMLTPAAGQRGAPPAAGPRGPVPLRTDCGVSDGASSTATPRAASAAAGRPSTPGRYSANLQDSSQIRSILSGGGDGIARAPPSLSNRPPSGGHPSAAAPNANENVRDYDDAAPYAATPASTRPSLSSHGATLEASKLAQLKRSLQQLEMQLSSIAASGGTGSESKCYAINRKLQRVRAEIIKEQREEEQLLRVQSEVQAQRVAREEDRRTFRR